MSDRSAPLGASILCDRVSAAVRAVFARAPDAAFLLRRAECEAAAFQGRIGDALRLVLRRLGAVVAEDSVGLEAVASALVRAGGALEGARDHDAARRLFEVAIHLRPNCASTALHAGRAARLAGDREAARSHYARARVLGGEGRIARLARIGEAMVSPTAEQRLSQEIRDAVRSGDAEAAGIGLEARAIFRCETERCRDAIRDLCACALRYPDREDQARAADRVAELLIRSNDLDAAREALLLAHEIGTPGQRAHARERLHKVSVQLGDVLGARRWSGGRGPAGSATAPSADASPASGTAAPRGDASSSSGAAATAGAPARASVPSSESRRVRRALPVIRDWRDAVERRAGAS